MKGSQGPTCLRLKPTEWMCTVLGVYFSIVLYIYFFLALRVSFFDVFVSSLNLCVFFPSFVRLIFLCVHWYIYFLLTLYDVLTRLVWRSSSPCMSFLLALYVFFLPCMSFSVTLYVFLSCFDVYVKCLLLLLCTVYLTYCHVSLLISY